MYINIKGNIQKDYTLYLVGILNKMNRYNKLALIYKIAVNKEQKNLGEEFLNSGKFSAENKNKIFAIAAQWWSTFNGTSVYENWKFLQNDLKNLNDVIRFIRENKDSVERAESIQEDSRVEMLSGIYPEFKDKFLDFNERFLAWLVSRYGENSKYENLHPIDQAIQTLEKYQEKVKDLRQKFDSNEKYKNLFNNLNSGAKNPSDIMKLSVNDMENAIAFSERPRDLHTIIPDNYEPKRFLGQFGPWKLWLPETAVDSVAIAKYNKFSMIPDTEWCTGRTFGHNLFYMYTTSNTFLFYAIKDGATKDNSLDYQSIGMVGGEIVYNGDGEETVDGKNNGMYEEDHRQLFGDYFEEIYSALYHENRALKNVHPVDELVYKAALGGEEAYESLTAIGGPSTKKEIEDLIIKKRTDIAKDTSDLELIEKFYNDKSLAVKKAIARNPNISIEMIQDIYINAPLEIKEYLAYNNKIYLPENIDILWGLVELPPADRWLKPRFKILYDDYLYDDFDDDLDDLNINTHDPDNTIVRTNIDKSGSITDRIKNIIARNSKTPEDIINFFFANKDIAALSGYILHNLNYIERAESIFLLLYDEYQNQYKYQKFKDNPLANIITTMVASELTPVELLEKIHFAEEEIVSDTYFLKNKNTSTKILTSIWNRIAANDFNNIRQLSIHPNFNKELLDKINEDKGKILKAEDPETPIEELEELSKSKHLEILTILARNPSANTEVIFNNLLKYTKFKFNIASRRDLPHSIVDTLSVDRDELIRKVIAKKLNINKEVFLRLSRDPAQGVRRIVYNNPSTPIDIVLELSKEFYDYRMKSHNTGSQRIDEYKLGLEAFEIIDNLYQYQNILLNDGVNINDEVGGEGESIDKVDRLTKRIAEVGSIVFYEADLTDLDLTQKYSDIWATNFIEKNKEKENLSRNERLALSLAKEIVQDTSEEGIVEEEEDMVIDKMSSLIIWLSKSGHKKEAADILSLYKEAAKKKK